MNLTEYLFQTLEEECAEVIQATSKINRFSLDGTYDDGTGNLMKLENEVNDIFAVIEVLKEDAGINIELIRQKIEMHKAKIRGHYDLSASRGALSKVSKSDYWETLNDRISRLQYSVHERSWGKLTIRDGKFIDSVSKELQEMSNSLYRARKDQTI